MREHMFLITALYEQIETIANGINSWSSSFYQYLLAYIVPLDRDRSAQLADVTYETLAGIFIVFNVYTVYSQQRTNKVPIELTKSRKDKHLQRTVFLFHPLRISIALSLNGISKKQNRIQQKKDASDLQ